MMDLLRKTVNPMKLFITDDELMKKLIGFLSVALDIDDSYLIAKLFREKFYPVRQKLPPFITSLFLLGKISPQILAKIIFLSVNIFAGTFIAGNGFGAIMKKVEAYRRQGFLVNLDILGEEVFSEEEAERYKLSHINFINEIGPILPMGDLSISIKGSAFYSQANPCAPEYSAKKILERLTPVLETIAVYGGHAYLDAEEYQFREIHFLVFQKLYEKFGGKVRFVLQSYFNAYEDLLDQLIFINNHEDPIWVRVVRGAYWDCECYRSELLNWPEPPVFVQKEQTDNAYKTAMLKGWISGLNMVPATHNISSICFAEEYSCVLRKPISEVQLLYGMGESIGALLSSKNIPVRFYMPVQYPEGKLREASGYLLRRINESQLLFIMKGLVRVSDQDQKDVSKLSGRLK